MAETNILESTRLKRNQKNIIDVTAIQLHIKEVAPDSKYAFEIENILDLDEDWISKIEKVMEIYNEYLEELRELSLLKERIEIESGKVKILESLPKYLKGDVLISAHIKIFRDTTYQRSIDITSHILKLTSSKKKLKQRKKNSFDCLDDYIEDGFPVNKNHRIKDCYASYKENINPPDDQNIQTQFNNMW